MRSRIVSFIMLVSIIALMIAQAAVPALAMESGCFTETEVRVSDAAAASVRNFDGRFAIKEDERILVEDVWKIIALMRNNYPELFCIDGSYTYGYKVDPGTGRRYVTSIYFKYIMTKEEYTSALEKVNEWVDKVVSLASSGFTDFEYALFFHDYICANFEYDSASAARDLYSFIKSGKGACQEYTYAFNMLMNKAGAHVSWAYSSEMNHIWNLVLIDGEWYHVDLTWDDPVGATTGKVSHKYFMLSDKAISTMEGKHYGWVSPYYCTSDVYDDSRMAKINSAYGYINDGWYYIKDGGLFVTDDPLEEGSLCLELDFVWNVWGSGSHYVGSYSGLVARGGLLYINTPTNILVVDTKRNVSSSVYTYRGGKGYIYGFRWYMGDDGVSGADLSADSVVASIGTAPDKVHGTERFDFRAEVLAGDADNNGKVNLSDAAVMLKYIAKWNVSVNIVGADYDNNGKVNLSDVSLVLKKIAGWK